MNPNQYLNYILRKPRAAPVIDKKEGVRPDEQTEFQVQSSQLKGTHQQKGLGKLPGVIELT